MMTKKRQKKKKKTKTDSSNDASDQEDIQQINQLEQKNLFLKHTIMTQTNQIEDLYHQINHLQEKEDEQQERIKAFNKFDEYVKRMCKNNRKVKTVW